MHSQIGGSNQSYQGNRWKTLSRLILSSDSKRRPCGFPGPPAYVWKYFLSLHSFYTLGMRCKELWVRYKEARNMMAILYLKTASYQMFFPIPILKDFVIVLITLLLK